MEEEILKRKVAKYVVDKLPSCDVIGIGSGSTVNLFIKFLAEHVNKSVDVVTASSSSSIQAQKYGLKEVSIPYSANHGLRICVDGADLVFPTNPKILIKGHGGALLLEKILWTLADEVFVMITQGKISETLTIPIPVEIIPKSLPLLEQSIMEIREIEDCEIKTNGTLPFITDSGNYILNLKVVENSNLEKLHDNLKSILGIIETGIFLPPLTTKMTVFVGTPNGVDTIISP